MERAMNELVLVDLAREVRDGDQVNEGQDLRHREEAEQDHAPARGLLAGSLVRAIHDGARILRPGDPSWQALVRSPAPCKDPGFAYFRSCLRSKVLAGEFEPSTNETLPVVQASRRRMPAALPRFRDSRFSQARRIEPHVARGVRLLAAPCPTRPPCSRSSQLEHETAGHGGPAIHGGGARTRRGRSLGRSVNADTPTIAAPSGRSSSKEATVPPTTETTPRPAASTWKLAIEPAH